MNEAKHINVYRVIGTIFLLMAITDLGLMILSNYKTIDSKLSFINFTEYFLDLFIGLTIFVGLWRPYIRGYLAVITIVPLLCAYSLYDIYSISDDQVNNIYAGLLLGFFGVLLYVLIKKSSIVFKSYAWVSLLRDKLLLIPLMLFAISVFLLLSFLFDNFIALVAAILIVGSCSKLSLNGMKEK